MSKGFFFSSSTDDDYVEKNFVLLTSKTKETYIRVYLFNRVS